MKRLLKIDIFPKILILLVLITTQVNAFEESIFEDEDIYRQALPPAQPPSGITAPGTKWCGPGNTSSSYDDLGTQRETDMCCRDHDHCSVILEAKSTLHGLNNTDWFPILQCSCEQKFINCLQAVNNMISNTLGHIYYSARHFCLAEGYPIKSCKQYQEGTIRKRCIRYKVDKTKSKIWQLYDMPFYTPSNHTKKT
ncbi:phospholipase A2-like [Cochliomyia hominivorax]